MLAKLKHIDQGWYILLGVPTLFICGYLLFLSPQILHLPFCAVRSFLDFDCPGCGLTRSIVFLSHGQIRASIDFHPLGVVIAVWLVYLFVRQLFAVVLKKSFPNLFSPKGRDIILFGFLIAMFVQWLVKIYINYH
ncbi:MAG: DUF2752 domain-containing protein [Pseudomonadota bacterium]